MEKALACVVLCAVTVAALDIEGRVKSSSQDTIVSINGAQYQAFTRSDGSFVFHDMAPGVYLLSVHDPNALYSTFKVNVADDDAQVVEYAYPGAASTKTSYPIVAKPHTRPMYFKPREQFSLMTFVKNPMMLMMLFSVFAMVILPKMMGQLDPEAMKEYQAAQAEAGDPMEMISKLFKGEPLAEEKPTPREAVRGPTRKKRQK